MNKQVHVVQSEGELLVSVLGSDIRTAFKLVRKDGVVAIVDTTLTRNMTPVSNIPEIVVLALIEFFGELPNQIVFKDTNGSWGRLLVDGECFLSIASLKIDVLSNELSVQDAIKLVQ